MRLTTAEKKRLKEAVSSEKRKKQVSIYAEKTAVQKGKESLYRAKTKTEKAKKRLSKTRKGKSVFGYRKPKRKAGRGGWV